MMATGFWETQLPSSCLRRIDRMGRIDARDEVRLRLDTDGGIVSDLEIRLLRLAATPNHWPISGIYRAVGTRSEDR